MSNLGHRRCDNWNPLRCTREGIYWLLDLKGDRIPGGALCAECSDIIIAEYKEKLNENWSRLPCEG